MPPSTTKFIDLKLNKHLLDATFEGYKLSLDSFPLQQVPIASGVRYCNPSEAQWSFRHVTLFSTHNHLWPDKFAPGHENVFFITDQGDITAVHFKDSKCLTSKVAIISFSKTSTTYLDYYNPCIKFPSVEEAFVSDGCGSLYLFNTGNRTELHSWKLVCKWDSIAGDRGFVLADSSRTDAATLSCILQYVTETTSTNDSGHNPASSNIAPFNYELLWLTINNSSNNCEISRRRVLTTSGDIEFLALYPQSDYLCAAFSRPLVFSSDTLRPVTIMPPPVSADNNEAADSVLKMRYSWTQTESAVTVLFNVNSSTDKENVVCDLTEGSIRLAVKDAESIQNLFDGKLFGPIVVNDSHWDLEDSRIELTLSKSDGLNWTEFVKGDQNGQFISNPELLHVINEQSVENPLVNPKGLNSQDLEECDTTTADVVNLACIDGNEHCVKFEADIGGHQWLFVVEMSPSDPLYFCLRHDVDGILWKVEPDPEASGACWRHFTTFNALGYVQASKSRKRFTTCSPDCRYALLADTSRHAYVYWQPTFTESDLRHRATGKRVKVAKQNVLSLESDEDIIGAVAANTYIFLLTSSTLFVFSICSNGDGAD